MYTNTWADSSVNVCQISRKSFFNAYESYLIIFAEKIKNFPIFNVLFSHVLPVWLLVVVFVESLFYKRWNLVSTMMLLIGQWGIMLLSPAMLIRYAYPLIICTPILLAFIIQPENVIPKQ